MMCQMFDSNDLKHAIKSFTGTDVSDDFISIMQKQLAIYGNTEIDFEEFRESFLKMTKSLYPSTQANEHSLSNPASPPPSPYASLSGSSSPVSTPPDLLSPPNSPRNYSDSSPASASPISQSPPRYIEYSDISSATASSPNSMLSSSALANAFAKPNPISPRRLGQNRARSSSLNSRMLPRPMSLNNSLNGSVNGNHHGENGIVPIFNDDQAMISPPKNISPTELFSHSVANSPQDLNHFNHNNIRQQQQQQPNRRMPIPINKQTSQTDLFMTLMSLNGGDDNGGGSNNSSGYSKKKKSSRRKKSSHYDDDSGVCSEDEDQTTFHMEEDWKPPKRYTYKQKNKEEEIGWATEEFYYDPTLTQLDDLHEVISILKEKYTISSTKVKELEKKVSIALKTNLQLEDELGSTKKEFITMSLKNNAFAQSKAISDQMLEECNLQIAQLKQSKLLSEKDISVMKKKLVTSEELSQKLTKSLEDSQSELQCKDIKHQHELESLNIKHTCIIEKIKNGFEYEINNEKERFNNYCGQAELEKKTMEEENKKLRDMVEMLNQQIYILQAENEEKQKDDEQLNLNNESMSVELLSTEKFNLNNQLHSWKKRYQLMEAKKIVDLKKELKRSRKEHSDYQSLILQGIQDFNNMESSIDNRLTNNISNNINNNSHKHKTNHRVKKSSSLKYKQQNNEIIVKTSLNGDGDHQQNNNNAAADKSSS